ncbi:hypothetical protein L7F22_018355 [Adiantum nelumboides]|nr:hypothetical protein [Adiantum nelumboides]
MLLQKASNPEVSQSRRSSLFEEYWFLLQRFYTYNLAKCTLSNASLRHLSDQPKTDVASITSQMTAKGLASVGALQNIDALAGPPFLKEIMQTASQNVKVFGKRLRSPTVRPAKKKIRILRLLHDSSSEDEERPLILKTLLHDSSSEDEERPLVLKALNPKGHFVDSGLPLSPISIKASSLPNIPNADNALPSPHLANSLLLMDKPGAITSAIPLSADNKSCEKMTVKTASSKESPPLNLKDSSFDRVSAVNSGLTATGTLAQPYNLEPLPASLNTSFSSMPNASLNISRNAAYMKSHSNMTADHLETDSHGGKILQKTAVTTDFTSKEAKILAPITIQNISLIFLRRSQIEELLADPKFTLLVLGAFVRIRNAKLGNNYRLVQIAGTTLQAQCYQVGKRSTNVVLEVQNLNKQQQINIDHVSDHMFTQEECKRLQQSVELGFIAAPTLGALELKAAALQKGKARKGALELKAAALQETEARQVMHPYGV